jgi:hypothetical protein
MSVDLYCLPPESSGTSSVNIRAPPEFGLTALPQPVYIEDTD